MATTIIAQLAPHGKLFRGPSGPTIERLAALLRQRTEHSPLRWWRSGSWPALAADLHPPGGRYHFLLLRPGAGLGVDSVYAHQALGLAEREEPQQRIEEMAAEYLRTICGRWPQGPYALLGWSLGGVVAYEMARQLVAEGREVAFVALVDARARRREAPHFDRDAEMLAYLVSDQITVNLEPLRHLDEEVRLAAVLGEAKAAGILPPGFALADVRRFLRVHRTNSEAKWAYIPGPYAGKVVLFRATGDSSESAADETLGWRHAVQGEVIIHPVPGTHATVIYSPHVHCVAEHLRPEAVKCLDVAGAQSEGHAGQRDHRRRGRRQCRFGTRRPVLSRRTHRHPPRPRSFPRRHELCYDRSRLWC